MPDIHRTEVRAVGHRVSNAVDDRKVTPVIDVFYRAHSGVQTVSIVQRNNLVIGDLDVRAGVFIETIFEWHDAVEVVIPARKLNDNQHFFSFIRHTGTPDPVLLDACCSCCSR